MYFMLTSIPLCLSSFVLTKDAKAVFVFRAAILEMRSVEMAFHHLVGITDFHIDGRTIMMGTSDISQHGEVSVCLSVCVSVCWLAFFFVCLSDCPSVCLPACLPTCQPVCFSQFPIAFHSLWLTSCSLLHLCGCGFTVSVAYKLFLRWSISHAKTNEQTKILCLKYRLV